jgi:dolichol-phosphate mannosyltransferase
MPSLKSGIVEIGPSGIHPRSIQTGDPAFSVVIPVFNEEGNLRELHSRLTAVFQQVSASYELIFVDDGSRDTSATVLEELYEADPRVTVLQFSRNFGHHLALTAGMDASRGEVVILMDADLQDRPEDIAILCRKLDEGYDVVFGIRAQSKHSLVKRITSRLFFRLMRRMVHNFDINTSVFRVARRRVIDTVIQCREQNRFVVGLISWAGFRQTGVNVQHAERSLGQTKYTFSRQLRLAFNTLTSFTMVPLRLAAVLGLFTSIAAALFAIIVIARKVIWGLGELGWPSLMVVILFLGGVQLLALGIFGEYLGRVLAESQRRPLYVVARRLARDVVE